MNSAGYLDAHCHVALSCDAVGDRTEKEALAVEQMVCCGTSPEDWPVVRQFRMQHPGVMAGYGWHPWFLPDTDAAWSDAMTSLASLLNADATAVVGEIGLDYSKASPQQRKDQLKLLALQLDLIEAYERVAVFHCVQAWGPLLGLLNERKILPRGFVLHGYSGSAELITALASRGAYFSFKPIRHLNSPKVIARVRDVPAHRLLLESDYAVSCDVPGHDEQSRRLAQAAEQVASIRGVNATAIVNQTRENAQTCFGLWSATCTL